MNAESDTLGLDSDFVGKKKILLPRQATTRLGKQGDRAKVHGNPRQNRGNMHTRGLDKGIYHLPRKSWAKIY